MSNADTPRVTPEMLTEGFRASGITVEAREIYLIASEWTAPDAAFYGEQLTNLDTSIRMGHSVANWGNLHPTRFSIENAEQTAYTLNNDPARRVVGRARIIVDYIDPEAYLLQTVEGLRAEITRTRAEAELKAKALNEKLQNLLAIGYSGGQS